MSERMEAGAQVGEAERRPDAPPVEAAGRPPEPPAEAAPDTRAAQAQDAGASEGEAALGALRVEVEALTDSHRRLAADFANYRRRVERDRADWEDGARGELLLRLLPVFDNLRRARAAVDGVDAGQAVGAMTAGLDMVLRGLDEALGAVGLEESVRVGDAFDPAVCEAIGEEDAQGVAPGHVSTVLQAGYRLGARVLRPALVRVAAAAPSGAAGASPEGGR